MSSCSRGIWGRQDHRSWLCYWIKECCWTIRWMKSWFTVRGCKGMSLTTSEEDSQGMSSTMFDLVVLRELWTWKPGSEMWDGPLLEAVLSIDIPLDELTLNRSLIKVSMRANFTWVTIPFKEGKIKGHDFWDNCIGTTKMLLIQLALKIWCLNRTEKLLWSQKRPKGSSKVVLSYLFISVWLVSWKVCSLPQNHSGILFLCKYAGMLSSCQASYHKLGCQRSQGWSST